MTFETLTDNLKGKLKKVYIQMLIIFYVMALWASMKKVLK